MNDISDKIQHLVELYRLLGKPVLEDDIYLICNLPKASPEIIQLILQTRKSFPGSVERFKLNGIEQDEDSSIVPATGQSLELNIRIPPNYFYKDLHQFVEESAQLSKGILRNDFYLIHEDYLSGDSIKPELINKLEKICAWIRFLQIVLHHTEQRTNWLTFILFPESTDGSGRVKISFRSKFTVDDLDSDFEKIEEFLEIIEKEDLHSSERKSVFRQALAELLEKQIDSNNTFSYILKNIDKLYQTYHDNYERYINSFSIEKLKKEVIDDYNKFSVEINNALNDIVTKAFAVPASLAASAFLIRLDSIASQIVMALVVFLTTIIYILTLTWQYNKLNTIRNDITSTFSAFSNSGASGSIFAKEKETALISSAKGVGRRLISLLILSFLPVLVVVIYISWKYS